ncbi:polyphosphate kinase 1 [Zobellia uliginosa]|uniref:polyphosphate kinase 1 n=1 Tax=Zobellia uliginosa TaxID=143224 RepID=UPI001C077639|nr:polyphosphate kinase 1 [Zobellia uliginosa]MBU2946628.1 polyphosphate kinase 1 [Zobellia uliginosa]
MDRELYKHRDVNWLFFNERVLLEAANPSTPLLERLKFLAIFSSNLDEFFQVRVSQLRQLKSVDKSIRKKLVVRSNKTLKKILSIVDEQQQRFGNIMEEIFQELAKEDIHFSTGTDLNAYQKEFLDAYFNEISGDCDVINAAVQPKLEDGGLYFFVVQVNGDCKFVRIPSNKHDRFIQLPGDSHLIMFLDDIVKLYLEKLLPAGTIKASFSIKLSRDAELYLEDDYGDTPLADQIYHALDQRKSGQPTRLLFDADMPDSYRLIIKKLLNISTIDLFPGGRYHNLSDFFSLNNPTNNPSLSYKTQRPLAHPVLSYTSDIFSCIRKKDQLVHFPYQSFDVVEQFISAAAKDDSVTHIKISLYRIAKASVLTDALLLALENGKQVTMFVEAKARFDEKNNIEWGKTFKDKGAKVYFSVPNIKVHSKIALVERTEKNSIRKYAYIGTGNFNSKTSKIYCDHGLFTADNQITEDLNQVFMTLERHLIIPKLKRLLVSPFNTRNVFLKSIEAEIKNSKAGLPARITAKMNSLEDQTMIDALYRASEAGVQVRLIVRGFCCLIPKTAEELPKGGEPIIITSIVDRYLEHGRIYVFHNNGDEKMYIGSADWMTRNLDRRIEVLTPILDTDIFNELKDILDFQLNDTVKARIQDAENSNALVLTGKNDSIRSQYVIYEYLKHKLDKPRKRIV